jgi:hypothetical protein
MQKRKIGEESRKWDKRGIRKIKISTEWKKELSKKNLRKYIYY